MKKERNNLKQYLVLFTLIIGACYFGYQNYTRFIEQKIMEDRAERHKQEQAAKLKVRRDNNDINKISDISRFRELFFGKTSFDTSLPPNFDNHWIKQEIERHSNSIESKKYDYIVLPVQERSINNDRMSKIMVARTFAQEIERNTGKKVMSPELALRLLGGEEDFFDDKAVKELALKVNADVIHSFVNKKKKKRKNDIGRVIKFSVVITAADGQIKKRYFWESLPEENRAPLEIQISKLHGSIVAELFENSISNHKKEIIHKNKLWGLPEKITDFSQSEISSLDHAVYLQFIAMLTPSMLSSDRQRLFERSLLSLAEVDPESDFYNLLKARALFHLYRRPSAIALLENATEPAEKALKEYINGNYPELQESHEQIKDPLLSIISFIELNELHSSYGKVDKSFDLPPIKNHLWGKFILATSQDKNIWYSPNALLSLIELNGLFPEFDQLLNDVAREQIISENFESLDEIEYLINEIFQHPNSLNASLINQEYVGRITNSDIWYLYRNITIANSIRRLNLSTNVHGNYEAGVRIGEYLEPLLAGHSVFMSVYATAVHEAANKAQGARRQFLNNKAAQLVVDSLRNDRGVNNYSIYALYLTSQIDKRGPVGNSGYVTLQDWRRLETGQFHCQDQWYGAFPSCYKNQEQYKNTSASVLPYTNTNIDSLISAFKDENINELDLEKELKERFNGHPDKVLFVADRLAGKGQNKKIYELLEEAISNGETNWKVYEKLGELLIDEGRYVEASKTFLKYPYFTKVPDDKRVEISNFAESFGSRLYWLGRYEEAKPLYEIAASLNTGANSQYISSQRIAIIAKDYQKALEFSNQSAKRYGSSNRYSELLIFLNLYGAHEEAEIRFKILSKRFDDYSSSYLWTGLFIGHRMQNTSQEKINLWLQKYISDNSSYKQKILSLRYSIMQSLIDRTPRESHLDIAAKLYPHNKSNRYSWRDKTVLSSLYSDHVPHTKYTNNKVCEVRPHCTEHKDYSLCKQAEPCSVIPNPSTYNHIYSTGFLESYIHFRENNYKQAVDSYLSSDRFNPLLIPGEVTRGNNAALPYFAMAASKTQAANKFPMLLSILENHETKDDFDFELTKAIIHAQSGKLDDSIDALKNAFHNRPPIGTRPIFSWYQITEIAEFLYTMTEDERFINLALDWAKRYQVIQPQFAWAYAFESKYSVIEQDRIRAAGFAIYLDSGSKWLSEVPESIRQKGSVWWKNNNPFIIEEKEETEEREEKISA